MTDWSDLPTIASADELTSYGVPSPAVRDKVRDRLHPIDREWLGGATLAFIGTSTPDGRVDVSPKGDPAGFAHVLDDHHLVIPERAGNHRFDGFHNILANPHVGLLFVIPGRGDTLRVNGTARIVTDGPFFDDLVVQGHRPALALIVGIEEVFYHCPKAFMRSKTWKPETWAPDRTVKYADIAKALWRADDPADEVDAYYSDESYQAALYPSRTSTE
jgi:uncharacterized protein